MKQDNWKEMKERVFERDGHQCLCCGSPYGLTVDHITPKSKGGKNVMHNLQTLCALCNETKDGGKRNFIKKPGDLTAHKKMNLLPLLLRDEINKRDWKKSTFVKRTEIREDKANMLLSPWKNVRIDFQEALSLAAMFNRNVWEIIAAGQPNHKDRKKIKEWNKRG